MGAMEGKQSPLFRGYHLPTGGVVTSVPTLAQQIWFNHPRPKHAHRRTGIHGDSLSSPLAIAFSANSRTAENPELHRLTARARSREIRTIPTKGPHEKPPRLPAEFKSRKIASRRGQNATPERTAGSGKPGLILGVVQVVCFHQPELLC